MRWAYLLATYSTDPQLHKAILRIVWDNDNFLEAANDDYNNDNYDDDDNDDDDDEKDDDDDSDWQHHDMSSNIIKNVACNQMSYKP